MANILVYIMGVSGSGKSTIGKQLSSALDIPFYDGDDFHPTENVEKMQSGQPLNDTDRAGWLDAIHAFARKQIESGSLIIACSALKNSYRRQLEEGMETQVYWVFLDGSFELILNRLKVRSSHFMPPDLLTSQFLTLERPEKAITVSIDQSVPSILQQIILQLPMQQSEFGLVGLGVMGKSLSRNLASRGYRLSLFNRHISGSEEGIAEDFIKAFPEELSLARGYDDYVAFVTSLEQPRKIFLMIPAGAATQQTINQLIPHLSPGDVLIDGGNAHYPDTEKRVASLKEKGIHFLGCGVSGGEEGALKGPSIMPGGSKEGYELAHTYLESIAALDRNGKPCCSFIGAGGAGHFVKMVHNGIEYAEMQLLAEVYSLLRKTGNNTPDDVAQIMEQWLNTDARSYLLEITIDILRKKEGDDWLLDKILDKAGNKGTGGWTNIAASNLGVPVPTISAALFARYQSALKDTRVLLSQNRQYPIGDLAVDSEALRSAYQVARLLNHIQGIKLIKEASMQNEWNINFPELARVWTNGCIIRSEMMEQLITVLGSEDHPLLHPLAQEILNEGAGNLKHLAGNALLNNVPIPCFSASFNYLLQAFQEGSTANMIQAQRDYFGAHTYQRLDDPSGPPHHTNW